MGCSGKLLTTRIFISLVGRSSITASTTGDRLDALQRLFGISHACTCKLASIKASMSRLTLRLPSRPIDYRRDRGTTRPFPTGTKKKDRRGQTNLVSFVSSSNWLPLISWAFADHPVRYLPPVAHRSPRNRRNG